MKKAIVFYMILVLILMSFNTYAFSFEDLFKTNNLLQLKQVSTCGGEGVGMANPAAVYCMELGYNYEIVTEKDGSQHGVCIFNKKNQCGGWEFLQGKCGQKYNYCAKNNYGTKIKTDGKEEFTQEYAVCVNRFGREIGTVTKLTNLNDKSVKSSREIPRPEEIKKDKVQTKSARTLPASFDWRDYKGENWMTPIKDQAICGSCWAFASIGVIESTHKIRSGNSNFNLDLSEEYLVSDCYLGSPEQGTQTCCGGWPDTASEFIRDNGVVNELCLPYISGGDGGNGCSCEGESCDANCANIGPYICADAFCSDVCTDGNNLTSVDEVDFFPYYPGFTQEEMKQYIIDKGPITAEMEVEGFDEFGIYRCNNPQPISHAVVILGFNDGGGYWIAKNSWGDDWNENGYFKIGYGECGVDTYWISTADLTDTDGDTIGDLYDNCDYTYNPAQGDLDGDEIGDACDTTDSAYQQFFFGDYYDTNGINYDYQMGGGPCNQPEGCNYIDNETDYAYCNGDYWPNYCVYEGTCYKGDGTEIEDIDGPLEEKHEARCIGFGWWDLDTGLPGINTCEEAGYIWTNNVSEPRFEVGEFIYSAPNNFGCCGDDENEYWDGLTCYESEAAANRKEKPILKSIPAYAFNLGFLFPFFKKKPL
ncbi:MAG: C1 family peptidase [Nanoarchaeota archaeon]